MKKTLFSIIIPSYNSQKTILACLGSLLNQKEQSFEILLVDSSKDKTQELVKKEFKDKRIKLIKFTKKTPPGKARNIGIKKAKGQILAFLDADCVAFKNWLEEIKKAHLKYDIVGGKILNHLPSNLWGWLDYIIAFVPCAYFRKPGFKDFLPAANLSFKREVVEGDGQFFPQTKRKSEDLLLSSKLKRMGRKIFYQPSVVVYHQCSKSFSDFLKHQFSLGQTFVDARRKGYFKYPDLADHPFLFPLFPFLKFVSISLSLLKKHLGYLLFFWLFSPFAFVGFCYWTYGCIREYLNE